MAKKKLSIQEVKILLLKKMFEMIGQEFVVGKKYEDGWYAEYEWSIEEQDEWIEWGIGILRKHLKVPKKIATKQMAWINVDWGWKIKNKGEECR